VPGERRAYGREEVVIECHAAVNRIDDVVSGCGHRVGKSFLECRDNIARTAVFLDGFGLGEDRTMRDETELARFRRDACVLQTPPQDVAFHVESEVLSHAGDGDCAFCEELSPVRPT
jgi:hypothetical protein